MGAERYRASSCITLLRIGRTQYHRTSAADAQESDTARCTVPFSSHKLFVDNDSVAIADHEEMRSASIVDAIIEVSRERVTQTQPRHRSLPSAEAGRAAGGTRDHGLPRSCGVRSRGFQPFVWDMYHLTI